MFFQKKEKQERCKDEVLFGLSLLDVNKKSVKIAALLIVVAMTLSLVSSVLAQEPYISYGYDWWWETYPVQSGYVVDRVVTSNELELSPPLKSPEDVFVFHDTATGAVMVFIVDTGNNRIVITDKEFKNVRILSEFYYGRDFQVENYLVDDTPEAEAAYWKAVEKVNTKTYLNSPRGIHVVRAGSDIRLYIADYENERVISAGLDGGILMEYTRPITATYKEESSFSPSKVLTDNAGNVYICVGIDRGAVVFSEEGIFKGYYGANRVTRTADAVLNYFLRFILTREQMMNRTRPVPVEFSNFTIDDQQFIYTVTTTRSAYLDIVKKLDPGGKNIFEKQGYDEFVWGDFTAPYIYGQTFTSMMVDISVDSNGDIYLFDRVSGKIFQYDKEGNLMFIFGGKGEQKGLFVAPVALETFDGKVYALDSTKNSITVFKLTEFGGLVIDAMGLFNKGLYIDSLGPWEEVLKRDANYYMAYVGMGNAKLSIGEFDEALKYFHMHSITGYGRAFKDYRINYIRENFDKMLAIALIAVGVLIAGGEAVRILRHRKREAELYAMYNE